MDATTCICIRNPEKIRAKLVASFQSTDKFVIYQTAELPNLQDKPSKHAPCKGFVHLVRPTSVLFEEDPVRNLVNESSGIFSCLQEIPNMDGGGHDFASKILKICREYRSALRACVEGLQENVENKTCDGKVVGIFYSLELIFHLCEIMCIDATPGSMLLPKLQDWMSFHYPISRQEQDLYDFKKKEPDSPLECRPEYWPVLYALVLRGRSYDASYLLGLHSKISSSPAISVLKKMLQNMPTLEEKGGTFLVVEFSTRWSVWQKDIRSHLDSGTFSHSPHLLQIAEVLAGSDRSLPFLHQQSRSWHQYLVSYLTFREPTVQEFQLGEYAHKCKRYFGVSEDNALDRILMALFEADLLGVIRELQLFSESGWAAAHVTDLLWRAGRLSSLDSHDHNVAEGLREDLLLQYGTFLLSHRSLWQLGLSYLDHCPRQGRNIISTVLPTLACGSETNVARVLEEAHVRNMKSVAQEIAMVRGRHCLRQHRLGTALMWALQAGDSVLGSNVADEILRAYSTKGTFNLTDLVDNLGTSLLVSDKLAFLDSLSKLEFFKAREAMRNMSFKGKYRQFNLSVQEGHFKEAAKLLMDLVTSGCTPAYFLPVLLLNAVPLIAEEKSVFNASELYLLLAALENLKVTADQLSARDLSVLQSSIAKGEELLRTTLAHKIIAKEISEINMD